MPQSVISAAGITVAFGATRAIEDAGLELEAGEIVALTGSSGSGKSTFLRCLAGLQRPDAGSVRFGGDDLVGLGDADLARVRRWSFGFVFQFAELVPELTIAENIALPLELTGVRAGDRRQRVRSLADRLGIDEILGRRPAQVSGGQAQRAAVARAIAHRPAVVFADEPTGALDSANGTLVLDALIALARDEGGAVLLVTHERRRAEAADRRIEMTDGRLSATSAG